MLLLSYLVQEFTIPGTELQKARELADFEIIVITLKVVEGSTNSIQVDKIFAADSSGSSLGVDLEMENPNEPKFAALKFSEPWTNAALKISENMLKKVSNPQNKIRSMRFKARKYRHNQPGHEDDKKEYVGYKVTTSR